MQSSTEIEQLVHSWFDHASRGDTALVDTRVARLPGTRLIGSAPEEDLRGGDAVAAFVRGEVESAGGAATFIPGDVQAFEEGSVGWATCLLTIKLPDGRQVSPRWSAVFHREDGQWRFVHVHASIGIANEDVGWVYPD